MLMDWKNEVRELAQTMSEPDQIKVEDIPKVNLYMEQLLSLLNDNLKFFKRYPDDQMLTKSMINNYSKKFGILSLVISNSSVPPFLMSS